MKNLNIPLTSSVVLLVKIIERGHTKYKQTIPVETTLEGVLNCGVPDILITAGVFECLGHPHTHYELKGITVRQPELAHMTEEYKERLRELDPEAYKKYVLSEFPPVDNPLLTENYRKSLMEGNIDWDKLAECRCPAKNPCQKDCGLIRRDNLH